MPRTTIDIDASVLRELKELRRHERKTLGELVSELLARALASRERPPTSLAWNSKNMRARVDLEDKDALYAARDQQ